MLKVSIIAVLMCTTLSAHAGCGTAYLANGLLGWMKPINYMKTNKANDLINASKHLLKSYDDQANSPITKKDRKLINKTYKKVDHIFPTAEDMAVEIVEAYKNEALCPKVEVEDGVFARSAFTYKQVVKFLKSDS